MLFNSLEYLACFLPIAFVGFWLCRRFLPQAGATAFLILASLVFYGWFAPRMVLFLLVMMALNWTLSRLLVRQKGGRALLTAAVTANLLPLLFYKYTTFLFPPLAGVLKLAAPLGISYFTFVQISFLVDTYRSSRSFNLQPPVSFLDYALASVFWPKTVAGPIVRPVAFARQWRRPCNRRFFSHRFVLAVFVFILGLGKKVVLADPLGAMADWGWGPHAAPLGAGAAWLSTFAYTLQIYFDFSGYSDMAWGSALLFNIRLPWNFNSPYKAASIQDFWRRWHISLSLWLRDYLYFTFGGSRRGLAKTIRNVFFTFLLGGIWHGAGWTFVTWGALHGAMLSVNNLWRKLQSRRLPSALGWLLTLLGVHFAWVFFRAPDATSAFGMLRSMFGLLPGETIGWDWTSSSPVLTWLFIALCVLCLFCPSSLQLTYGLAHRRCSARALCVAGAACGVLVLLSIVCGMSEAMPTTPFVYFKF